MGTTQAIASVLNHTRNVNILHLEDVLFTGVVVKNATGVVHHPAGAFGYKFGRVGESLEGL